MNTISRALAGASLLVAIASPAIADEADATIVVTAAADRAATELAAVPGGTDLVTADEFAGKLAVSLRDTLAFSPGVYTQPRFGQEVRLSIRGSGLSRGYHMRGLTLLQDGIPINLADDNGDFQELDPQVFQHIEVWRGGNALRLGGSTLGGAINAVTPTGLTAEGIEARVDGGSFDTVRGKLAAGFASGRGDAFIALTGDTSDGDRDHARRSSLRLNANAGLRLTDNLETRFYASVQDIAQELPGALGETDVLTAPKTGNFVGDQARDIESIRLQNRTTLALGGWTVAAGAFLNLKDLYHPIFQVIDQSSTDYGVFARGDGSLGPVDLTLGATARFGSIDSQRFVNVNGKRGAKTVDAWQQARTINAYGEARVPVTPQLSAVAGGIFTHGRRTQDQSLPVAVRGEADFDAFSPKLGLVYTPAPDVQVYASYNRSVELPGFAELAQVAAFVPLDPQRAWTAEIGTRGRIGIARWDLSLYRADLKGELLQFTVGPDIPASTFNAGKTRHQGIEAGLELAFTDWLRLRQVYQFSDFRFRDDAQYGDNRLPVVPKHVYRAELRLGGDTLNIAPSLEWVPQGAWADYANSKRADGYVLLGASARAEVREGISLFVDARNLTGEKAVGDISAVVNYAALAPTAQRIFYPVERRAVYAGVSARF